jgi:hypothetical protein
LNRVTEILTVKHIDLFSVVVDFRHSLCLCDRGVEGSRTCQILSSHWWGLLVTILAKKSVRRLFVEYDIFDPLGLSKFRLREQDILVILAKRAACILGLDIFWSSSSSIHRQVLSWARKTAKSAMSENKLERIKKIIHEAVFPLCYHANEVIATIPDLEWDLRKCPMPKFQRQEYEKCCLEVRGALSSTLSGGSESTLVAVVSSLFRLRRSCFHPNFAILENLSASGKCGVRELRHLKGSSSQPDVATVKMLLDGSAKLRELLSILVKEAGHCLVAERSIQSVVTEALGKTEQYDGDGPKKVAILASLPEIQFLVSLCLYSVGIQNVVLSGWAESNSRLHHVSDAKELRESLWFQNQSALGSLFREDTGDTSEIQAFSCATVVVASPLVFRHDVGLGLEGAEMIVVLDTDWSGRDGRVLNALITRWVARNSLADRSIELLKLICNDSIEEHVFLTGYSVDQDSLWPVLRDDCFTLPDSDEEAIEIYCERIIKGKHKHPFPAIPLMSARGNLLSDVLATSKMLPPLLDSGETAKFLPLISKDGKEHVADIRFLRQLLNLEVLSIAGNVSMGPLNILSMHANSSPQLSNLPAVEADVLTRHDLTAIPIFVFLEQLAKSQSVVKTPGQDGIPILSSQVTATSMTEIAAEGPTTCSGDVSPSTMLLYETPTSIDNSVLRSTNEKRRINCFAKAFSSCSDRIHGNDGCQGEEALVFFPPLFSIVKYSAKRPRHDFHGTHPYFVRDGRHENSREAQENDGEGLLLFKRNPQAFFLDNVESRVSKRPRIESEAMLQNGSKEPNKISEVTLPTSNKKDPVDLGVGDASAPSHVIPFDPVEDDFGLLGTGAFAPLADSTSYCSYDSMRNGVYHHATEKFDFLSYPFRCDTEEIKESASPYLQNIIGDLILFIKNKPRLYPEYMSPFPGRPKQLPARSQTVSSGVSQPSFDYTNNGEDLARQAKKRSPTQMLQTSSTHVTGGSHTRVNLPQRRKDYRRVALATFQERQRTTGLSMFDSVQYRMSAISVERRVAERIEQLLWKSMTPSSEFGSGINTGPNYQASLNLHCQTSWANVVETLPSGSATGDAAKALSKVQIGALRMSLVSPCRVDFGPFEAGFFAARSGMRGISSTRDRVGVSLPMGVKVTQIQREESENTSWERTDMMLLNGFVMKFGKNWLLVARAMSGFEHRVFKSLSGVVCISRCIARSSIDCRDRWQEMMKARPPLEQEFNEAHQEFKERSEPRCIVVRSKDDMSLIVSPRLLEKDSREKAKCETDSSSAEKKKIEKESPIGVQGKSIDRDDTDVVHVSALPATKQSELRKSFFGAVSMARTKKHVVPTPPGVVSGQPPNHPVPSHPSHIQAVQSSITAQWAQGRTELWPLQILDLADKQRSAMRAAAAMQHVANGSSPSSRRSHHGSSVPASHRTQSSRPAPGGPLHRHGPYPTLPPNAPRPVAQPRGPPPLVRSAGSPPQLPHSHLHQQTPSPPVASNTAQAYVPPQSASSAALSLSTTSGPGGSHNIKTNVPKPGPAAQPSTVIQPSPATQPLHDAATTPAADSKPEASVQME